MVLDIPYSFIPGTKAKANEVNSNFLAVKTFVDTNEANIATNQSDIQNLENNKADLNGNISNRFQVADPTGNYDAVNKQYFKANIANSLDYIGGFKLTKQSNTSISASAGSCWDSTYEYMITSDSSLTKDQSNLGNNATYYVYVCADKETTNNELVFSLSNSTPELPAGFEYFRLLGKFTTANNGHISQVINNDETISGEYSNKGYVTLAGGITIQWGYADVNLNNSSVDIDLPKAYTTSHLCCVCSPNNSWSNGDWDRICIGCQPISLSKIRIIGGRSASYRVYYISIGI